MRKQINFTYNGSCEYPGPWPDVPLLLQNLPRGEAEAKGLIVCPRKRYNNWGGSTLRGTPGRPKVEQSFSCATSNIIVNKITN